MPLVQGHSLDKQPAIRPQRCGVVPSACGCASGVGGVSPASRQPHRSSRRWGRYFYTFDSGSGCDGGHLENPQDWFASCWWQSCLSQRQGCRPGSCHLHKQPPCPHNAAIQIQSASRRTESRLVAFALDWCNGQRSSCGALRSCQEAVSSPGGNPRLRPATQEAVSSPGGGPRLQLVPQEAVSSPRGSPRLRLC